MFIYWYLAEEYQTPEQYLQSHIDLIKEASKNYTVPKCYKQPHYGKASPCRYLFFLLIRSGCLNGRKSSRDEKVNSSEAIGLATYSNSEATVLSHSSIFELLWIESELHAKR